MNDEITQDEHEIESEKKLELLGLLLLENAQLKKRVEALEKRSKEIAEHVDLALDLIEHGEH